MISGQERGIVVKAEEVKGRIVIPTSDEIMRLGRELSIREDFGRLVREFDAGNTPLRDISGFTESERQSVLEATRSQPHRLDPAVRQLTQKAARNLKERMGNPLDLSGWEFLKETQRHLNAVSRGADLAGVKAFDDCWGREYGHGINVYLDFLEGEKEQRPLANTFVARIAKNPDYAESVGLFLAERSLRNERFQETLYGKLLETEVKPKIHKTFQRLASEYGLPAEHIIRTHQQISRTRFSALDPLLEGVREYDKNSAGDYVQNTLRVEIKFVGNPGRPRMPSTEEAKQTLGHEVFHSSSAQDEKSLGIWRGGILGLDPNEAMTQYLNQITLGFPGFYQNGEGRVSYYGPYKDGVNVMHQLKKESPEVFMTLFNRYFGDPMPGLAEALARFYEMLGDSTRR